MSQQWYSRRILAWSCATLALVFSPKRTSAQHCAGNISSEVLALEAVSDSLVEIGFPEAAQEQAPADSNAARSAQPSADADPARSRIHAALVSEGVYLTALGNAGTAAACLFEQRALYRSTFESSLPSAERPLTEDDVKAAARRAASAVLGTRYSATDRVGILFGFGMTSLRKVYSRRFKVVSLTEQPSSDSPEGSTPTTVNYVVEESRSSVLPLALTGIAVRFRDREDAVREAVTKARLESRGSAEASRFAWLIDHVLPTTVFGSVQLSSGGADAGPVNGTALGLGWRVVGDVTILVGYSATRVSTLRRDILDAFDAVKTNKLRLQPGESDSTINGTQTATGWIFALGVPVSLQSVFGGGGAH